MKNNFFGLLFLVFTTGLFAQTKENKITQNGIFVEMETSKGNILLELFYKETPLTVANFITLIEGTNDVVKNPSLKNKPYYDGLKFHRVIANFMIQGGDPEGTGSGGPGYKFKDEITSRKHDAPGILSMANAGPATNGSQFFITHVPTPWLDGKHTVFGKTIKGMDVVNSIQQNDVMKTLKVHRVGDDAKKFNEKNTISAYFAEELQKQKSIDDAKLKEKEKIAPVIAKKIAAFKTLKQKSIKTDSGLEYAITHSAKGKTPENGTKVYVNYSGYLEDGTLFDSSIQSVNEAYGKFDQNRANTNGYKPLEVEAGKYPFIPGFTEGLNNMKLGDKATLFIPYNLGYGERGAGGIIPGKANLIFEVELLEKDPTVK